MFTGIIEEVGTVQGVKPLPGGRELKIKAGFASEVKVDQSISINGVCHTVTACDEHSFSVQSVDETLRKTSIGDLEEGMPVNLERSLRPDQLLDGHLVQGHVDGTGTIADIQKEGTDYLFTIEYPEEFAELIVGRGSICVDGISLTVAREEGTRFTVAIIPYTYEHTNLNALAKGDRLNLEFDIIGKYVVRYLKSRGNG